MKRTRFLRLVTVAIPLSFGIGCGDSVTNPGGEENGTVTATIDGDAWTALQIQTIQSGNIVSIAGANALLAVAFAFQEVGPGTYTIGTGQATSANVTELGTNVWTASGSTGSGTIVVTTLTPARAIGTFEFVLELTTGTGEPTRTVASGAFDVDF